MKRRRINPFDKKPTEEKKKNTLKKDNSSQQKRPEGVREEKERPSERKEKKEEENTEEANRQSAIGFLRSIIEFKKGADIPGTIEEIMGSISFKGYHSWVLVCSIIIASVGLNVGSVAVIIGAMLISPLMGPIRGMGLAVATNDMKTLKTSFINLLIAVGISLLFSFLYFKVSPIKTANSEILARTEPQILDVMVAIFGGLAGIIAASRRDTLTVVPGVAIATALMPPLCTAGFGLANGQYNYFLGAMYLFVLNSVLIGLSTILVVRYLNFPLAKYMNKRVENRNKIILYFAMILIIVPSGYQFYRVIQKTRYEVNLRDFVNRLNTEELGAEVSEKMRFDVDENTATISFFGSSIDGNKINEWKRLYKAETGGELIILANAKNEHITKETYFKLIEKHQEKLEEKEKVISDKDKQLEAKEEIIQGLENKVERITQLSFNMQKINKGLQLHYQGVDNVFISQGLSISKNNTVDTIVKCVVDIDEEIFDEFDKPKLLREIQLEIPNKKLEVTFE